jgi:hypothetical protein
LLLSRHKVAEQSKATGGQDNCADGASWRKEELGATHERAEPTAAGVDRDLLTPVRCFLLRKYRLEESAAFLV